MRWLALPLNLLWIAIGVPLWRGQIAPNRWYGYRTASTLASEEIWYAVNRWSGAALVISGIVGLLCWLAIELRLRSWKAETRVVVAVGASIALVVVSTIGVAVLTSGA
jgi:uncharacterized membrane protein